MNAFDADVHYLWAAKIATRMHRRLPPAFDVEDLKQAARIAVWKCSETYDESRGVTFERYAYEYVAGAVLMLVRRRHWTSATKSVPVTLVYDSQSRWCQDADFINAVGFDGTLAVTQADQDQQIDRQKQAERLYRAVSFLPPRERAVVSASDLMDAPMPLIATRMGCSLSLAYSIRQRAIEMLRQRLETAT